jgi:hypothetical protein
MGRGWLPQTHAVPFSAQGEMWNNNTTRRFTLKFRLIGALAALSIFAVLTVGDAVASSRVGGKPRNVVLVYNGPAVANTHFAPRTPAFTSWCDSVCAPTVTMPATDATTGRVEGKIYVWSKDTQTSTDGKTLCFGEFIWFALDNGAVYTDSGTNGTCGAFMDPSLKPPTHIPADQVVAGGGDGTIVGGTGRYARWTGAYTDRLFIEFGAANYYDQLFFSINPN